MSKVLSSGEICVGMKITVLEWKPREISGYGLSGLVKSTIVDTSFCGDVCEVVAIDLPYIIIKRIDETMEIFKKPTTIDTRRCVLMELSKEYVNAKIKTSDDL